MITGIFTTLTLAWTPIQQAPWTMRVTRPLASIAAILVETPVTDQTGISNALIGLARIGVGILAGVLTAFLVIQGYQYMSTDEASRGVYLKRGLGALLGGAILVLVAVTLAPQLVTAIVSGSPAPQGQTGGGPGTDF